MAKMFSDSASRKIKLGAVKESWRMGRFATLDNITLDRVVRAAALQSHAFRLCS